jgi:hypothetical protein
LPHGRFFSTPPGFGAGCDPQRVFPVCVRRFAGHNPAIQDISRRNGVVWSGDPKPDANGKLPDVGNTVDVANAIWTNSIGATELITVWADPDFDPSLAAVYYARVIEIPTPRWTAYEAKRYGIKMPEGVEMITRERAYTSPIWYTPNT